MQETLSLSLETIASLFVNRSDVYAVQTRSGAWALVGQPLTNDVLLRHIEGKLTVGSYQLDERSEVKWICFDFDGENANHDSTRMLLSLKCTAYGRASLLEDTGGRGFHIWVFFSNRVAAWQAKKLAEKLADEAGVRCETFPKEVELATGGYGHLVRLPQGIHLKTGRRSKLIEPDDLENVVPIFIEPEEASVINKVEQLGMDVYPCWKAMNAGVAEGSRHEATFAIARRLRAADGFDEAQCLNHLVGVNKKNSPPMSGIEVAACVHSVYETEYPNIGCLQVKDNIVLSKFCDETHCPWKSFLDRSTHTHPRSSHTQVEAAPRCRLNDDSLVTKYYALILETLGIADLTMLRCNDALAIEHIESRRIEIEGRPYWTEEALMDICGVGYARTPCDQVVIFTNAHYIGRILTVNRKRRVVCPQHVWYVRFLWADGASVKTSWAGLLMMTPKRIDAAGLEDPVSVFPGICILLADAERHIIGLETNIQERL